MKMDKDDNRKNGDVKSLTGRARVSFALPVEAIGVPDNNAALGVDNDLRLLRPNTTKSKTIVCPTKSNRLAGHRESIRNVGKNNASETRKCGTSTDAPAKHRSCSVNKYFVRDSDLPVSSSGVHSQCLKERGVQGIPRKNRRDNSVKLPSCNQGDCQSMCRCYRAECSSPELLSSLSIAKKIQSTTAALKEPKANIYSLHPLVEQEIEEKASNRLNLPFDELVYRDLVTLNIRDEDYSAPNREKCKCSKDFESSRLKDEEPLLSDFYQPRYGEEYSSVTYPVPYSVDKVRRFNGLSIYNKMHFWE